MLARALAVAAVAVASAAHAKEPPAPTPKQPEAKQHYADGMVRMGLRDWDAAIKEFNEGFRVSPDPLFQLQLGHANRLAGKWDDAAAAYRRYLRGKLPADERADVEVLVELVEAEKKRAQAGPPAPSPRPKPGQLIPAMPLAEPETKAGFLTTVVSDGKMYTMVGIGARKIYGFNLHAMALYVEDEPARAQAKKLVDRAGGRDLAHLTAGDLAQEFLLDGDFGKAAQLKFVRGTSAKELQRGYREALGYALPSSPSAKLKRDVDRLIALFAADPAENDEYIVRATPAGEISVETRGIRLRGPTNQELARALWQVWLGKHAVSAQLRKQLVDRIDALAH